MNIVSVSTEDRRHTIPLQGWESVEKALTTFASGGTRASQAASKVTAGEIEQVSGSMGAALFAIGGLMQKEGRNSLVGRLLANAKEALETRDRYSESWDYDGMGTPFFKATVDIIVLDREQEMFGVRISAAYVGDKPEQGLAEHYGIPRALASCVVEVETEALAGDCFEFDFEPVLRKLDSVLGTSAVTGIEVASAMMALEDGESRPAFTLYTEDQLEVRIAPGRVESRFKFGHDGKRDTWSVEGSVLRGELRRDYSSEDESAKAAPTLSIAVASIRKDRWGSSDLIWQPDLQQKASGLAERIAGALR